MDDYTPNTERRPLAMTDRVEKTVGHREMLGVALPVMLSNLSVPLLGLVDTAAVGQLPDAYHIGAVAIGALIFDFIFWGFGFLRMGTSGFAAQAEGRGDDQELRNTLGRALVIALVGSFLLLLFQSLIAAGSFYLIDGSKEVEQHARIYFDIRIWSAARRARQLCLLWLPDWHRPGTGRADLRTYVEQYQHRPGCVLCSGARHGR